jgi:hypothetical protein
MMESLEQLLVAANVRGLTKANGARLFSVYDFIREACNLTYTNANKKWRMLLDAKSPYKHTIEAHVVMIKLRTFSRNVSYETPAMEIDGLKLLLRIFGKRAVYDFRKTVAAVAKVEVMASVVIEDKMEDVEKTGGSEIRKDEQGDYHAMFRQKLAKRLATASKPSATVSCSTSLVSKHSIPFILGI